jgi:hypothetical protein
MLNAHIPTSGLQGRAPLQAYPQATHSGRISRPEWEAEMLELHFDVRQEGEKKAAKKTKHP